MVEGSGLRHCIGQGAYDDKLRDDDYRFYSVRDPDGLRLATVETKRGVILQFLGRENHKPDRALTDLVDGFRGELGWRTLEEDLAVRQEATDAYLQRRP